VSRIFLSHASNDSAQAVALRDWLEREGWDDIFLDLDPERGIAAGERWERALNQAVNRCEAVLFVVSRAWLDSRWCQREFNLAHKLNKRLFGLLIEPLPLAELPVDLTGTWQVTDLVCGGDHASFQVKLPRIHQEVDVSFSQEGLRRLRAGLVKAGLDPRFFAWPPANDPDRSPYRGLRPLEAEDAGIFFGRNAPILEALDRLRGLREAPPPRLLVVLGASGAGKSSFLRAGLFPRLVRDDRHFLPLPIIRPDRAVISGEAGLLRALEGPLEAAGINAPATDLHAALQADATKLGPLLQALTDKAAAGIPDDAAKANPPTPVILIDQGEELFRAEGQSEANAFLAWLQHLLGNDAPAVIVVFAIRSDSYGALQETKHLDAIAKIPFDLGAMPKGSYTEVIKGPATRLEGTARPLKVEDVLVDELLGDIERGGAKDALPLLAFTLERLYLEHGNESKLTLSKYRSLGGIKGSIEAAVERALKAADANPTIPKDPGTRLALLRRGLIPWLAGIDPETGAPRRRVARQSEIPAESRPLIQNLVEQRLLTTDVAKQTGEITVEPAHEALLRQWGLLERWLAEDAVVLGFLEGVKRASRDWEENGKNATWLAHTTDRLAAAERLSKRPDLAASLEPRDHAYIAACRSAESAARVRRRRIQALVYTLLVGIIGGLVGWINQDYLRERFVWFTAMRPYMLANFRPYLLPADAERQLKPSDTFRECAKDCPEMIVIPPGEFVMGSPDSEEGRARNEGAQHKVTITRPFAVSVFDVTFDEWDACVAVGGCPAVGDSGFGRGRMPVTNVTWNDAQTYVAWLAKMTSRNYRLPTEAEWEYMARAGTTTTYYWGNELGKGNANCNVCGTKWDNVSPSPVGSFKPNPFGLYDVTGNVWQWLEDCLHNTYDGAPTDGSAWTTGDCSLRVDRGGSWISNASNLRIAFRGSYPAGSRNYSLGVRVVRTVTRE
jgi:formylglycine-generating enzyme required for sulfatase activity